ncbi:MAG TPA: IPT/TIG domain-containing protein [Candidatus Sulfotelmatobacter sp.]|nr:IPT/TIG domain-containing protein [Candidatus Sulfotelmatobacter sp.]
MNSGPIGASVTLTGTNFGSTQGSSTVVFNNAKTATVSTWGATSIAVTVPAGATRGNVVVQVGGQNSNGVLFTVTPAISNLSVTSGPEGTALTVNGTTFG